MRRLKTFKDVSDILGPIIVDLGELESAVFLPHQIGKINVLADEVVDHGDLYLALTEISAHLANVAGGYSGEEALEHIGRAAKKLKRIKKHVDKTPGTQVHGGGTGDD